MGQGIHTKVLQIVAEELGVPFEKVYLSDTSTSKVFIDKHTLHKFKKHICFPLSSLYSLRLPMLLPPLPLLDPISTEWRP